MKCVNCGGAAIVTDSVTFSKAVIRRRKCRECGKIFITEESTFILHKDLREKFWKVRRGEEETE